MRALLSRLAAEKPSRGDVGAVLVVVAVAGLCGALWAVLAAGGLLLASQVVD